MSSQSRVPRVSCLLKWQADPGILGLLRPTLGCSRFVPEVSVARIWRLGL